MDGVQLVVVAVDRVQLMAVVDGVQLVMVVVDGVQLVVGEFSWWWWWMGFSWW